MGRRGKDKHVSLIETTKKILKEDFCIRDGDIFENYAVKMDSKKLWEIDLVVIPTVKETPEDAKSIAIECGSLSGGVVNRISKLANLFDVVFWIPYPGLWYQKVDAIRKLTGDDYYMGSFSSHGIERVLMFAGSGKFELEKQKIRDDFANGIGR